MQSSSLFQRPPTILLGMHRSGTSLVAKVLSDLGLFQGHQLQGDHEAVYFLRANDILLQRLGASWDNPSQARTFLDNPDALRLTAQCLRADLESTRFKDFIGIREYWKRRLVSAIDAPWGWKDPRTIFTLPVWLEVFPEAKLVYVVRNGVDVAASLRERERHELQRREKEFSYKRAQWNRHSVLERAGFKGSARCMTLAGGFALWEEYVAEADRMLAARSNPRMEIRYESFLADPVEHARQLARFCELPIDGKIEKVCTGVRTDRAFAFLSDPELLHFYDSIRETHWMLHHGYGGLTEPEAVAGVRPRAWLGRDG